MTHLLTKQDFHAWYFIPRSDWGMSAGGPDTYIEERESKVKQKILQTNIVQGLFPQKKFPVINELYDEELLYRKTAWRATSKSMAYLYAYAQLKTNFENRAYTSMYQNHIMKIADILHSLAPQVDKNPIQWDKGVYTEGKIYLELGKFAATIATGSYFGRTVDDLDLQFELLFITHEEWNDNANQSDIRIQGVSFNPNNFRTDHASHLLWDIYTSQTLEENCEKLQQVYELTYEVYVELIRQLNAPFNVSLNYPGGNF